MINKKLCILAILCLISSTNVVLADEGGIEVDYTYDNLQQTEVPEYFVSVPVGIQFSTTEISSDFQINIELKPLSKDLVIPNGSKVQVRVKSRKGFVISLDEEAKEDPIPYKLVYGNNEIQGKAGMVSDVGVLQKGENPSLDVLRLEGYSAIEGVARKTGSHSDVLTFIIEDISDYTKH